MRLYLPGSAEKYKTPAEDIGHIPETVDIPETVEIPDTASSKTKPAAIPDRLPPTDSLDAEELESLFNDAARSIL